MALKRVTTESESIEDNEINQKTKNLFADNSKKKETKVLTTFSIEPSFKKELEDLFSQMGLSGWSQGIRFALTEFYKKYKS